MSEARRGLPKRGLPGTSGLRHSSHYVEELAETPPTPVGRYLKTAHLMPNPYQPRVDCGDLTDLAASIREKGVLEPLLVRALPEPLSAAGREADTPRWIIIAGERRWRAAQLAELAEIPCIVMDASEEVAAEIALVENMQRKDLTAWEEADGLAALSSRYGYTHEDIARKVGKSRSTISESLFIAGLPTAVREICQAHHLTSKSTLLQIARQPDEASMYDFLHQLTAPPPDSTAPPAPVTREQARTARRVQTTGTTAKPYKFRFQSPGREFALELKFTQPEVTPAQVAQALREVLAQLEAQIQTTP